LNLDLILFLQEHVKEKAVHWLFLVLAWWKSWQRASNPRHYKQKYGI